MNYFDSLYCEGFKYGYLISNLQFLIDLKESGWDEINIEAEFPGFNDEIKEKIMKLEEKDYHGFYEEYEDFFKSSLAYPKAETASIKSLHKRKIKEEAKEIIEIVDEINSKITEDFDIKVAIIEEATWYPEIEFNSTQDRVNFANEKILLDSVSSEIAIDLIINKEKSEKVIFRIQNVVVIYDEYNRYYVYSLRPVDISKTWVIITNNYSERIQYVEKDQYGRILR